MGMVLVEYGSKALDFCESAGHRVNFHCREKLASHPAFSKRGHNFDGLAFCKRSVSAGFIFRVLGFLLVARTFHLTVLWVATPSTANDDSDPERHKLDSLILREPIRATYNSD